MVPILSHMNTFDNTPLLFYKIYLSIITPSTSKSYYLSLSFLLPNQDLICIPVLPIFATCPANLTFLNFSNLLYWTNSTEYEDHNYAVFTSLSLIIPLRSKYSKRPLLKYFQFLPTVSYSYKTTCKIIAM
jgi:hypothetical protein